MEYINTIPLPDTITIFEPTGERDIYGKPTSYTITTSASRTLERNTAERDNFKKDFAYNWIIYCKNSVSIEGMVYIGTTAETDPNSDSIKTYEVKRQRPMRDVFGNVAGYKIWL